MDGLSVTPEYSIGIVAHVDRRKMARDLFTTLLRPGLKMLTNVDDGELGCSGNHAFLHARLATELGWSVILEDDAVPLNDFHDDLEWCLGHAPAPIVSFYLGTGYPQNWQRRMVEAVGSGASWILCPRLLHAVGYAIAPEIKRDLATWMARNKRGPGMEPDEAITVWANKYHHTVAYTNPSLVDHRDTPSAIRVRRNAFSSTRNRPRHAHNTCQRLTWDDSTVRMDDHGNRRINHQTPEV